MQYFVKLWADDCLLTFIRTEDFSLAEDAYHHPENHFKDFSSNVYCIEWFSYSDESTSKHYRSRNNPYYQAPRRFESQMLLNTKHVTFEEEE